MVDSGGPIAGGVWARVPALRTVRREGRRVTDASLLATVLVGVALVLASAVVCLGAVRAWVRVVFRRGSRSDGLQRAAAWSIIAFFSLFGLFGGVLLASFGLPNEWGR